MKKLLMAIFLIAPLFLAAQNDKPIQSDYTIAVHVQSSQLVNECRTDNQGSNCYMVQRLAVTIDGKKYEIEDPWPHRDLLRTGVYKAKIAKDETERAYEYLREYELLFADGKTRKFLVVGEME